jgi:hypothetical protein
MCPDECESVLKHLIHEWLLLRGLSLTSAYMEEYKIAMKKSTKQRKGIRGELKQQ